MRRSILAWVAAAAVILGLGVAVIWPSAYSIVTGRPMVVDCGALTDETCDRAMNQWARAGGWGPVTSFVVDQAQDPESTCADVTITRWGLDLLRESWAPLCQ